ncbi:MAG TPA: MBL fold metallo-hydrolase [Firmicutes bacterium]|nr:MBL fold metallo-hydrolase [Bacillota bacterium]
MKIRYLGHSCFVLTESTGTTIVTDPYGEIGYRMPSVKADAVTVSHGHYDHNNVGAVEGNPVVFDEEGTYEIGGVDITAIKSFHDDDNGAKRGENLIFKFRMDGLEICHLGDLGEECSSALIETLLPVHVLLIPVGGNYTIDAEQAKEYVDRIMPAIVIPMHYKTKGLNIDVDKVDDFADKFDTEEVEELEGSELELFRDDISEESTKVIIMEREK